MDNKEAIKRVFTIEYKVKNFNNIENDIDLFILGIANIKDDDDWTVLTWSSYYNNLKVVQALIQAGADLNIKNNYDWTALILASHHNNLKVVQALIQAGADLNIKSNNGWTALMRASHHNHLEVVQTLIQAGADLNIKNNHGRTALDLTDSGEIRDLLKQAGAK